MASKALNIRVTQELNEDLHNAHKLHHDGHFQDYVSGILRDHLDARRGGLDSKFVPAKLDHITELLAEAVAKQLKKDSRWAMDVVLQSRFHLPGESVFGERVGHYSKEKERIAGQFSTWLVNRLSSALFQSKKVCLIIDGGSTLYWVFRALGEPLKKLADREPAIAKRLSILSINLPGIEAYMSFAQANRVGDDPNELLSHLVPCHVLGGRLEPSYSAVAVEEPIKALRDYKANNSDTTFIGLVTGNWIRVAKNGQSPTPLWRDKEQGEFKRGLVTASQEIYCVAPLPKVFVSSIDDVNEHLGRVRKNKSTYRDVPEAIDRAEDLRLVTTSRVTDTLLHDHSTKVQAKLDADGEAVAETPADMPFTDVPSLMFTFPELRADLSRETQFQWECPHSGTREPAFLRWAYGIKP